MYYWNLFTKSAYRRQGETRASIHSSHANAMQRKQNEKKVRGEQQIIQIKVSEKKSIPHCEHRDGTHKSNATNNIIYMAE